MQLAVAKTDSIKESATRSLAGSVSATDRQSCCSKGPSLADASYDVDADVADASA